MTYIVTNREHNIELTYEHVENIIHGAGLFVLCLANGETATFHCVDEDGSEWDYFRKTSLMHYMLTFENAFNGYAEYFHEKDDALAYVNARKYVFAPKALYEYDESRGEYVKVGSFTKAL